MTGKHRLDQQTVSQRFGCRHPHEKVDEELLNPMLKSLIREFNNDICVMAYRTHIIIHIASVIHTGRSNNIAAGLFPKLRSFFERSKGSYACWATTMLARPLATRCTIRLVQFMHSDSSPRFPVQIWARQKTQDEDGIDMSRFFNLLKEAAFDAFRGEEDCYLHDRYLCSGGVDESGGLSDEELSALLPWFPSTSGE
ncbi:hypothetical protein BDV96DRAFT_61199 [Lophiotrema nucula]|uniref:Uncharacterized protein n=1 Tax=Lophiotrema nucula TaxID=690887 RepID=A0A6A5Z909_9PLEO|nr:hypothetical protein BDV96DRAFT_61199 [Lophiotrema nucula]